MFRPAPVFSDHRSRVQPLRDRLGTQSVLTGEADHDHPALLARLVDAGVAIDRAHVAGDLVAHRLVRLLAQTTQAHACDVVASLGPLATRSERLALRTAAIASRYENARRDLDRPSPLHHDADPPVEHDLRVIATLSKRAEEDAAMLLTDVDHAAQRLAV